MEPKVINFLTKIRPAAEALEEITQIPWLFGATQAAHESAWGLSRLTVEANNLFGMTADATGSWAKAGKPVYEIRTQEYDASKHPFFMVRGFRKYATWQESLEDWAGLLQRRYPSAMAAARDGDFIAFAHGLQAGGYATDPNYATQLVELHQELQAVA